MVSGEKELKIKKYKQTREEQKGSGHDNDNIRRLENQK